MLDAIIAGIGGAARAGQDIASDNIAYQKKVNFQNELLAMEEQKALRARELRAQEGRDIASHVASKEQENYESEAAGMDAPGGIIAGARKAPKMSDREKSIAARDYARSKGYDDKRYDDDVKDAEARENREWEKGRLTKSDTDTAEFRKEELALRKAADARAAASEGRAQKEWDTQNDPAGRSMLVQGMESIANGDKEAGIKALKVAAGHYGNKDAIKQLEKLVATGQTDKSTIAQLAAGYAKIAEDMTLSDTERAEARRRQRELLDSGSERKVGASQSQSKTGGSSGGWSATLKQ